LFLCNNKALNHTNLVKKIFMRNTSGWWIVVLVMLLIDLYVFMAVRTVTQSSGEKTRITVYSIYWLISVAGVVTILLFPYVQAFQTNVIFRNYMHCG
jgi:uncharacterized protein